MTVKIIANTLSKMNMYRNITDLDIIEDPTRYIVLINELRNTLKGTMTIDLANFFDEAVLYLLQINAKAVKKKIKQHRILWAKELLYKAAHRR